MEYAALSEEEKQTEALYAVLEPLWMPMAQPISIQEYGTEDGWRVRKWRDGYVELSRMDTTVGTLEKGVDGQIFAGG